MKNGDKVRDPNFPEDGVFEFDEKRDRMVKGRLILVEQAN